MVTKTTKKSTAKSATTTKKVKRDYLQERYQRALRKKHATQEQLIKVNTTLLNQLHAQMSLQDKELELIQSQMMTRAEVAAADAATKTATKVTEQAIKHATKKVAKSLDL